MKKLAIVFFTSIVIAFTCNSLYAQANADSLITAGMMPEFKNDTLFYNTGLKLYVGQKFVLGNASGETGQYRAIVSGRAAIVPSIWGQDMRYENAIEHYVDSKKDREKIRQSLVPGIQLTIKRIGFCKVAKPHFYLVSLSSGDNNYSCDIKLALTLKELLLQP